MLLRFLAFFALLTCSAHAMDLRTAPLTRVSIGELTALCERHAKNEQKRYVLLTGMLLQNRFEGRPMPSCTPTEDHACRRYDWFPHKYTGVLIKTNHYKPDAKIGFYPEDFTEAQMHALNFSVQKPYAVCAEPKEVKKGMPLFEVPRYEMMWALTHAE